MQCLAGNEINNRDHAGLTVLHRAASSSSPNAISFALALIEHPAIDLYIQDKENGWTALHRALYFGNVTIARAIPGARQTGSKKPGKSYRYESRRICYQGQRSRGHTALLTSTMRPLLDAHYKKAENLQSQTTGLSRQCQSLRVSEQVFRAPSMVMSSSCLDRTRTTLWDLEMEMTVNSRRKSL